MFFVSRDRAAILALVFCSVACVHTETRVAKIENRDRVADAPRPPLNKHTRINLGPLFNQRWCGNVYALTSDDTRTLMDRVLLSPNLVFESSRSSAVEPKVQGPETDKAPATDEVLSLPNALGTQVYASVSGVLMNYLGMARHGKVSKLIAPAFTKRFGTYGMSADDPWWKATWVERLMLMSYQYHVEPANARDAKGGRNEPDVDWPTCGFAVRTLKTGTKNIRVVATTDPRTGEMLFRPRQSDDERSECGANFTFNLPAATLQAEIVSMRDGRLLARINETRTAPAPAAPTRIDVESTVWAEERATAYTQYRTYFEETTLFGVIFERKMTEQKAPVPETGYSYVTQYREKQVLCENARREFAALAAQIERRSDETRAATLTELFKATIDPLYGMPGERCVVGSAFASEGSSAPAIDLPMPPPPAGASAPAAPEVDTAAPAPPPPEPPPAAARPGCKSNAECKGGRICDQGKCVQP